MPSLRKAAFASLVSLVAHQSGAQSVVPSRAVNSFHPDSASQSQLLSIGLARLGPDGRVYVLDRVDRAIRVFDPTGRLVGTIGRRGAGPGEFQSINSFGWVGDTLWVMDGSL